MQELLSSVTTLIDSLSQQISESPSVSLYLQRSENYAILGEVDLALKDCQQAIELDSTSAKAFNLLAGLLIKTGDYVKAEEAAETANRLDPEVEDMYWMVAAEGKRLTDKIGDQPTATLYCKRGILSATQGAFVPAKADLEQAITLDNNLKTAYTWLIEVCLKLGLPADAEKYHDDIADRHIEFSHNNIVTIKKWMHLERKIAHSPALENYYELSTITSALQTIHTYKKSTAYLAGAKTLHQKLVKLRAPHVT
jgi:tetratricopeptide (TPR) repeat protein